MRYRMNGSQAVDSLEQQRRQSEPFAAHTKGHRRATIRLRPVLLACDLGRALCTVFRRELEIQEFHRRGGINRAVAAMNANLEFRAGRIAAHADLVPAILDGGALKALGGVCLTHIARVLLPLSRSMRSRTA